MKFEFPINPLINTDRMKLWSYNSKDELALASVAVVEVSEMGHGRTCSSISDRIFYVLAGEGVFFIGESIEVVSVGDVVVIPKGIVYDFKAQSEDIELKLLLVNTPAFEPLAETNLG